MTGAPLAVLVARLDHELTTVRLQVSTGSGDLGLAAIDRALGLLEQIRTHRDLGGR